MNILLTGSSGLIGTAVRSVLEGRGDTVVRLVRPQSAQGGTSIGWDPSSATIDLDGLNAAGPFDAVIHLAGAGIADKRWSPARKNEIFRSRVDSTELLVSAFARLDVVPKAFVSGSAIGIYGSRGDEVLSETSAAGTGFLAEVCEAWEQAATPATRLGIRTVLARTGIVLSQQGGALGRQLPLFRLGLGGKLGAGRQWLSWISLDDEIDALLACCADDRLEGPINLTAPTPVTNEAFTRALGRALRRPAFLRVPPVALRTALGVELVDEALLASQRVVPSALQTAGFTFSSSDLDHALATLFA